MKTENLERASEIYYQRAALNRALAAVIAIREGDEQGDKVVDDYNKIELTEINSNFSLELKGCDVGGEILVAIEGILLDRVNYLLEEARSL